MLIVAVVSGGHQAQLAWPVFCMAVLDSHRDRLV